MISITMADECKKKRSPSFKLQVPGESEDKDKLLAKLRSVKDMMMEQAKQPINNYDVLDVVLDYYLSCGKNVKNKNDGPPFTTYLEAQVETDSKIKDAMFVSTQLAASKLVEIAENHSNICAETLVVKKTTMKGHVTVITYQCTGNKHRYTWASSPHMPQSGKFYVNYKIMHGFETSGMLPVAYERFCSASLIGCMDIRQRNDHTEGYNEVIEEVYQQSLTDSMADEISHIEDLKSGGITVMSDARHGWRKNSKDTSVVVIGDKCHKVLAHQLVTKADDPCSQRHETLGTKAVMDQFEEKGIMVDMWVHDRNVSINNEIKRRGMINQNDLWHGIKNLKKVVKGVSCGAKKNHDKTWHTELDDKVNSIANHAHYAARHSNGSGQELRRRLDNAVHHYKNDHSNCPLDSRCKTDSNYEPSKKVIVSSFAEAKLSEAIHSSTIYINAEDFAYGKDSHYVESFNNVLNIFEDKRISFSSQEYHKRAKLACLHWNENVDREFTSEYRKPSAANRHNKVKKTYKDATYCYRDKIWTTFVKKMTC